MAFHNRNLFARYTILQTGMTLLGHSKNFFNFLSFLLPFLEQLELGASHRVIGLMRR